MFCIHTVVYKHIQGATFITVQFVHFQFFSYRMNCAKVNEQQTTN